MDVLGDFITHAVSQVTSVPTLVLAGISLVMLTLYYWPVWNRHKYPPGPIPLPFFGDIPLALKNSKNLGKHFYDNREKYGEVFTMRFEHPTVFLNSPEAVYEGLVKNANTLSSRPSAKLESPLHAIGLKNTQGVVDGSEGKWQPLRRHLLSVFKEKGVGKKGMEEVIKEEIKYFLEELEKTKSQPLDLSDQLVQSISNVATHIVFGKRFDYNAEQLSHLQFSEFFGKFRQTNMAPLLRHLPGDPTGFQQSTKSVWSAIDFSREEIAEHRKDIDVDNPRDYIDSFLAEIAKTSGDKESAFTDENLLAVVIQIYVAGTDTTSSSLYWAFLYMILYPDVQQRVYDEIQAVIGDRTPTAADRQDMPYTMSTVTEILRTEIAVTTLPHYTSADTVVRGYTIPKGTIVFGNLWSTTHNEDAYDEPSKFKADRFLDSDGKFVKPDQKYFAPFSSGRRACPGEALARAEIFLFLVCTLQKFRVELGQDTLPSDDGTVHFVQNPQRYKAKFVSRV